MGRGKRATGVYGVRSDFKLSVAFNRENGQYISHFGQLRETLIVHKYDRKDRR